MSKAKWAWVREAVHSGELLLGWMRLVFACCGLVAVASALTYFAPEAAGSGIPHVKSYLNGNRLPGVLRLRVLFVKVVGIACCVAAGIPVGREGPMVHAGAIVAGVLARLWAKLVVFRLPGASANHHHLGAAGGSEAGGSTAPLALARASNGGGASAGGGAPTPAPSPAAAAVAAAAAAAAELAAARKLEAEAGGFDNDRDRRNLVSMGAAAGVAAAFGAPIGGILFSLEEVSSFWDPTLTWTTFIAAAVAAFTVEAVRTAADGDGVIGGSHFSLVFASLDGCTSSSTYAVWEVLPFAAIGILCGLLGALFNATNTRLTRARKCFHRGRGKWTRVLEATLSVALVVSFFYWASLASTCREMPAELQALPSVVYEAHQCDTSLASSSSSSTSTSTSAASSAASSTSSGSEVVRSRRLSGGGDAPMYVEINELATLLLQNQDEALLQLFSRNTAGYFGLGTLAAFAAIYFCAAVFTYGLFMPSGLFVPCMLTGSAIGRLAGELLRLLGASGVDPGLYALVGAAGVLVNSGWYLTSMTDHQPAWFLRRPRARLPWERSLGRSTAPEVGLPSR